MGPVNYNNLKLRIGAAFVSGLYMLIHATNFDVYRAITTPRFYFVLAISCTVALILIEYVHYMTKKLDNRYGWRSQLSTRIIWQTIYGIIIPGILDLFLIGIYFHFLGENILDNGYFQIDFPMVLIFLLVLNGYYYMHYHMLTEERKVQKRVLELVEENNHEHNGDMLHRTKGEQIYEPAGCIDLAEIHDTSQTIPVVKLADDRSDRDSTHELPEYVLTIKHDGVFAQFDAKKEVLYFHKDGRKVSLITKLGKKYFFIDKTIIELEEELCAFDFCKINRTVLINCDAIRGYSTTAQRDTFRMILKKEFDDILPEKNEEHFFISRRFLNRFKNRFDKI